MMPPMLRVFTDTIKAEADFGDRAVRQQIIGRKMWMKLAGKCRLMGKRQQQQSQCGQDAHACLQCPSSLHHNRLRLGHCVSPAARKKQRPILPQQRPRCRLDEDDKNLFGRDI